MFDPRVEREAILAGQQAACAEDQQTAREVVEPPPLGGCQEPPSGQD